MPLLTLSLATGLALAGTGPSDDPIAAAASRYAAFDGIKVHYKLVGDRGPALVLVHGWSCNLGFWREQAPLARVSRLVLVDLPGHGQSDKPERAYTIALFARAVEAVVRDAGLQDAVLAGHSMGTAVVWQFSRLFPERTRGLIAVDGSFRPFLSSREEREKWAARYRGKDYEKVMAGVVENLAGKTVAAPLRDEILREMLRTPQHVAASAAFEMSDPRVFATEPKLSVPVLAVYANAPYWGADYRTAIEAFIPRLEYRTLDGVGHFLMLEKPAELDALILDFLRRQGWLAS